MGIKIDFDITGSPQEPSLILAYPSGKKIGNLLVNGVIIKDSLNSASEISFTMHKFLDAKQNPLWEQMTNFKRIWWKEQNVWFQATVELDDSNENIKTVYCIDLPHAELAQIMLYGIEINTEDDIARDDYTAPTIIYDSLHPESSLLDRITEKAPHYEIIHVDDTIAKLQRTFSFDNTSIYDAFQTIASEINCIFILKAYSDENGHIKRTIAVYDLEANCLDCGYRGEFSDICPKCGSVNILKEYGADTSICISTEDLADNIQFTTDTDAVKNCFKLVAGDDLMTATIRNCNPNGTDYIWYFSDDMKNDMSESLKDKLGNYDTLYSYYQNNHPINIDASLVSNYNTIIEKYKEFDSNLKSIHTPIYGYGELMETYYQAIDLELYLKSSLMPNIDIDDTDAQQEANLLTADNLSPVAVSKISSLSLATANNAVLSMAKVIVDSRYRVVVNTSSLTKNQDIASWTGNFIITNYSDDTDTATSNTVTITINDDYESFLKQKIEKALNKENSDDMSIVGLFEKDYADFCNELKKYSLNRLESFLNACQACIDILVEQGVGSQPTWSGKSPNLYDDLYLPYYQKLQAIESEMTLRQNEINIITGVYDADGNLTTNGIQPEIIQERDTIQAALNFENYLGSELWLEFLAFRREDTYQNDNYISDGLDNSQLFQMAQTFLETASKELYKSAEMQHSISASLKNLFGIQKLQPWANNFEVGNWMRIKTDDQIYKLRLLEYQIDFDNFDMLSSVQFSDVLKVHTGMSDVQSILSQATSMATSYDSVKRQANKGEKSNEILDGWFNNGLDATTTKIISGTNGQTQTWDEHGMLFRQYDPITGVYNPSQMKIINDVLALTTDNWQTTKTAIGHFYYNDPATGGLKEAYGVNGETIVGRLLIGQELGIYNSSGTLTFDDNGFQVSNANNAVIINPNSTSLFTIRNKEGNVFSFDQNGNLVIVGEIMAQSLTLLGDTSIDGDHINGLSTVALTGLYSDLRNTPDLSIYIAKDQLLGNNPQEGVTGHIVSSQGQLKASNAIIYGQFYSSQGKIGGLHITNNGLNCQSSNKYAGFGLYDDNLVFYAGSQTDNGSDAIYRLYDSGKLFASDTTLKGDMTAIHLNVKSHIAFWADDQDENSAGNFIQLKNGASSSGNIYYDLILGKSYNSNLAESTSSEYSTLKFRYVRIPGELVIGDGSSELNVSHTLQSILERLNSLESLVNP